MGPHEYPYDIVLSFAGEDRELVEQLAAGLLEEGVRVFYDAYEQSELWGKDLYQHMQLVYRDSARYCVIFVSSAYAQKIWTRHELKQAQARAIREQREYILPVRLDDTEIPGLNSTTGYFDLRHHTVDELRTLILEKIFGRDFLEDRLPELTWDGTHIEFRGQKVMSTWPAYFAKQQTRTKYIAEVPRIRYGEETSSYAPKSVLPCHDCAAIKGEYHASGCDMEQCPVCREQAISCGCIIDPDAV